MPVEAQGWPSGSMICLSDGITIKWPLDRKKLDSNQSLHKSQFRGSSENHPVEVGWMSKQDKRPDFSLKG